MILFFCIGVVFFSKGIDSSVFITLYAIAFCVNIAIFLWVLTFVFSDLLIFSVRRFCFGLLFSGLLTGYFFLKSPSLAKFLIIHNFFVSLVIFLAIKLAYFCRK